MKWRFFYLMLTTLILAAIIHILIILLVPKFGTRDAWTYLAGRTGMFEFTQLNKRDSGFSITEADPFFKHGVCRFELNNFALKMEAPSSNLIWTASVFDEEGAVLYSLNNRTAINGKLDLLILDPLQSLRLREAQTLDIASSVVIEANLKYGFVILRVFQADESWQDLSTEFLKSVNCSQFEI